MTETKELIKKIVTEINKQNSTSYVPSDVSSVVFGITTNHIVIKNQVYYFKVNISLETY